MSGTFCAKHAGATLLMLVLCSGIGSAQVAAPPTLVSHIGYQKSGHGLNIVVDSLWVDNPGYRPLRVTLTPLAPLTADRAINVQLVLNYWERRTGLKQFRIDRQIEIPAGSGPVEAVLSVPQGMRWSDCGVMVSEDGVPLPQLSQEGRLGMRVAPFQFVDAMETLPRLLVVGDALPETARLAENLPEAMNVIVNMASQQISRPSSDATVATDGMLPTAMAVPPGDLPEQWIDYTCLDVVCLSIDQLASLGEKHPKAFEALLAWTDAGGTLWVYGIEAANSQWGRLAELNTVLGLPVSDHVAPESLGWRQPEEYLLAKRKKEDPPLPWNDSTIVPLAPDEDAEGEGQPGAPPPAPEPAHFVHRAYGFGMVVALAPADPFPGTKRQWRWVLSTMGANRWAWTWRHGLSTRNANGDFWDFLIPGIGLAPVVEFQVLITLFVLVIGPANYYLLRRYGRLYLLVLTIPAAAVVVVCALVGYAILSDGLGTRVRAMSVTRLDQRRGRAVCWARLSYYAGIAPSHGLVFPADTAVFPRPYQPRSESPWIDGDMSWWDDGQHLTRGWLSSRTPTQYLTITSRAAKGRLVIGDAAKDAKTLAVENALGCPIDMLVIRATDGTYYAASQITRDASFEASEIGLDEALAALRRRIVDRELVGRSAVSGRRDDGVFGFSERRDTRAFFFGGNNMSLVPPNSLLESTVSDLMPTDARSWRLEPGTYVALTAHAPELQFGVQPVDEEASLHFIMGQW